MGKTDYAQLTVHQLIDTWNELSNCISKHPEKLIEIQTNYWQDYINLFQDIGSNESQNNNDNVDKRFNYKDWQENISLHFIKQSYLLFAEHVNNAIKNITEDADEKAANKIKFYSRQFTDAISPTNFAHINPEVLSKTLESNGVNLIMGMKQFLEDIERGNGQLNIQNTHLKHFNLGEDIACTPGKVVYQNDVMQLIHYTASTEEIYQVPLLIIPPWINKYYILDLQPENSLVKWLVDQGFSVFMISWVNANSQHREKQFSDYMQEGPLAALDIIKKITQEDEVNMVGYCIGGTLLSCMLAYLAKKNEAPVKSATFLTTLLDFSEPGELGVFIDETQVNQLEQLMKKNGYLDGNVMALVFNALRANDLIWSAFVNNYLKGQQPKPFDMLYWNADSTNIPEKVHLFYLRNMYLNNNLIQSNKIKLVNVPIDLNIIKTPSYFLAAQDDHIVPWQAAYKSSQYYGGKVKFTLTSSGHVAGVVNPPHKNKYGYWTNSKTHQGPETFLSTAKFTQGSWWNDWIIWLKKYSGKIKPIYYSDKSKHDFIENAPGSYVKIRIKEPQQKEE